MASCPANETVTDAGSPANHPHFMDTVFSSILLCYIIVSILVKSKKLVKDVAPLKPEVSNRSILFSVKAALTLFLSTLALVRLLLHGMVVSNHGNVMVASCLHVFIWPVSLTVVLLGQRNLSRMTASRGRDWILAIFWIFAFINENLALLNLMNDGWWHMNLQRLPDKLEVMLYAFRYLSILMLFILGLRDCVLPRPQSSLKTLPPVEENEEKESVKEPSPFEGYLEKLKMFSPFLWPKESPRLQVFVVACFLLLAIERFFSVLQPLIYKGLVDSLSPNDKEEAMQFRWDLILAHAGVEFLENCLSHLRNGLWQQVDEFTRHEVEMLLFSHLHRLSLSWHLSKKTGEVLEVLNNGTSNAQDLLKYILYDILPSLADICIATIYFMMAFNMWFGVILFITMILYSGISYICTSWLSKLSDEVIRLYPDAQSYRVDSLLNFETVKCCNNEDYEISRYKETLMNCWNASWKQSIAYDVVYLTKEAITMGGLLAGSLLCAHMIVTKQGMTLGDYVLFAAYAQQFWAPMYSFGSLYGYMERSFKEMEKLIAILHEEEEVKDIPDAPDLVFTEGRVEFKDVSFNYRPEKCILKNVSFVVQPGQTLAFVGPTGSGKSTIIRLLFRLYNLQVGCISIDGQCIAEVTQRSVRRSIGLVPQDTVLFNEDIRFNIRYGDVDASDEKVEAAAVAAEIHDAVLRFPDGYNTKVGERGLKLSGGEKQRIAIARTILKSAPITVLDEATSSLDTQTERSIQAALKRLCACRTTIIIAHRLSTIIHAHQICVLQEGEIVERGTHEELLKLGKVYSGMWQAQMLALFEPEAKSSDDKDQSEDDSNNKNETAEANSCRMRLKRRNSTA